MRKKTYQPIPHYSSPELLNSLSVKKTAPFLRKVLPKVKKIIEENNKHEEELLRRRLHPNEAVL